MFKHLSIWHVWKTKCFICFASCCKYNILSEMALPVERIWDFLNALKESKKFPHSQPWWGKAGDFSRFYYSCFYNFQKSQPTPSCILGRPHCSIVSTPFCIDHAKPTANSKQWTFNILYSIICRLLHSAN